MTEDYVCSQSKPFNWEGRFYLLNTDTGKYFLQLKDEIYNQYRNVVMKRKVVRERNEI